MDTSFLQHVYGLVEVKCTATHYKTNKIVIEYSETGKVANLHFDVLGW